MVPRLNYKDGLTVMIPALKDIGLIKSIGIHLVAQHSTYRVRDRSSHGGNFEAHKRKYRTNGEFD